MSAGGSMSETTAAFTLGFALGAAVAVAIIHYEIMKRL